MLRIWLLAVVLSLVQAPLLWAQTKLEIAQANRSFIPLLYAAEGAHAIQFYDGKGDVTWECLQRLANGNTQSDASMKLPLGHGVALWLKGPLHKSIPLRKGD